MLPGPDEMLSVGAAAARLGVSPSALRQWGTRYGLHASARSPGGHRRYTPADLERLLIVHSAVLAGEDPARAAARLTGSHEVPSSNVRTVAPARRRSGAGGSVLAVPGGSAAARGLARAASRLDEPAVEEQVTAELAAHGTAATWERVLRPVLQAAGEHWARRGDGIEVEHLLTSAVTNAFTRHTAALPATPRDRPVLLANGPDDDHVLPLHALRAALVEMGVPTRLLGARTPVPALAVTARRTRSAAVLVWCSRADVSALAALAGLTSTHRRARAFVGGSGWDGAHLPAGVTAFGALEPAARALGDAWRSG